MPIPPPNYHQLREIQKKLRDTANAIDTLAKMRQYVRDSKDDPAFVHPHDVLLAFLVAEVDFSRHSLIEQVVNPELRQQFLSEYEDMDS